MILVGIIGWQEIIILLILILLITGGGFIPSMMRKFGKSVRNFEERTKDPDDKIKDTISEILKEHGK